MSIPARVSAILKSQLDVDDAKIVPAARLRGDLNASSIDIVEIIAAFENEFNITIPDDAAQNLRTVGDAIAFLEKTTA
jgi:acyl carrier protein